MKPRPRVLLAGNGHIGVVLRRGPAREVAAIGWNCNHDTFTVGEWLRGRIYELRSALSPDGSHLIYFAMNGHWARARRARGPRSRARRTSRRSRCSRRATAGTAAACSPSAASTPTAFAPSWGGECRCVYFPRLLRDGWTLRGELAHDGTEVFERPLWHGWVLRKLARVEVGVPGKSIYFDEHELVHPETGRELVRPTWEWASPDLGRLVWAERGALWAGMLTEASAVTDAPVTGVIMLRDFSDLQFEAMEAPYARSTKRPGKRPSNG